MTKARRNSSTTHGSETRLAYSTGGEVEREPPPPPPQKLGRLRIRTEGRPGGRTVTIVEGFGQDENERRAFLAKLKRDCSTGGTLKDGTLELQGDHRDVVAALLRKK